MSLEACRQDMARTYIMTPQESRCTSVRSLHGGNRKMHQQPPIEKDHTVGNVVLETDPQEAPFACSAVALAPVKADFVSFRCHQLRLSTPTRIAATRSNCPSDGTW